MTIVLATIFIFSITVLVWFLNRFLPFKICPVCAGVSGTWLLFLAARFYGISVDPIVVGILLGGSVVGIMYQLEKRLPQDSHLLLWKIVFISAGFFAVYRLLEENWSMSAFWAGIAAFSTLLFYFHEKWEGKRAADTGIFSAAGVAKKRVEALEDKMKNCC